MIFWYIHYQLNCILGFLNRHMKSGVIVTWKNNQILNIRRILKEFMNFQKCKKKNRWMIRQGDNALAFSFCLMNFFRTFENIIINISLNIISSHFIKIRLKQSK